MIRIEGADLDEVSTSAADLVEQLEQLMRRQLDLLVAPFRGTVVAGD